MRVKSWLTACGAMDMAKKAKALPVRRVACQGKLLAPKARRTRGIRRIRMRTLAGKAK